MTEISLPTASEMHEGANLLVQSAVEAQLPKFVDDLIEGMKPGIDEMLEAGISPEAVKVKAVPFVKEKVELFDPKVAESAAAQIASYIDTAHPGN